MSVVVDQFLIVDKAVDHHLAGLLVGVGLLPELGVQLVVKGTVEVAQHQTVGILACAEEGLCLFPELGYIFGWCIYNKYVVGEG